VALNVGDLLIGEGYRLIAAADVPAENRAAMLKVAAEGHRAMCLGQGEELAWAQARRPLGVKEVLSIFRRKTSPAFEVALQVGAMVREIDPAVQRVLRVYSEALGEAYQIRDDLEDFARSADGSDLVAGRPNIVLALAWEQAHGENRALIEQVWRGTVAPQEMAVRLQAIFAELGVEARARELLQTCKQQAIDVLAELDRPHLKALLRRVIGKIFRDAEIEGWCREFAARNAGGGAAVAQNAG
jgi:geranylgeranyl diphosphate synthase, type II